MLRHYVFFICCSLLSLVACSEASNEMENSNDNTMEQPSDPDEIINDQHLAEGLFYPKGKELKVLCTINNSVLTDNQRVCISTLQGLAAKMSGEQIYIEEGGASTVWKNHLNTSYGVEIKEFGSFEELVTYFCKAIDIQGYVLYNKLRNSRSLTAAVALCGPLKAVAVDKPLEKEINSLGITTCLMDVSDRDEKWVFKKYKSTFYKKFAAELSPDIEFHLRDYVTLTNCFIFYDGLTYWRNSVLQDIQTGGVCLGGGLDEFKMIKNATEQGIPFVGTDMAPNLATLSSIYDTEGLCQPRSDEEAVEEEDVHYVTFMLTDGDNVSYDYWTMYDIYSDPIRGSFPVGYTISPSLYDLAPSVLNWYYQHKTVNDYFVCAPSGLGYTFPTLFPQDKIDAYLNQCNRMAKATGLHIFNVIDAGGVNNMSLWEKYLQQPDIDAIFYTGFAEPSNGTIKLASNGKPVVEAGDLLWGGLSEESDLIDRINAKPANPKVQEGYTLVIVHVWTKGFKNMKTVVDGLNKNVKVVTPEMFVKLIKKNLGSVNK